MSDKDGKTEQPTAKRLKDAREKGDIPKSPDLVAALSLLAFSLVLLPLWEYLIKQLLPFMKSFFQRLDSYEQIFNDLPKLGMQLIVLFFLLTFPFLAVSLFVGMFGNLVQVGLLFSTKVIKPNFGKLNPLSGFKNLFGMQSLVNSGKTIAKFLLVFYLCYQKFLEVLPDLAKLNQLSTIKVFHFILDFAKGLMMQIAIFLFVIAIVDYMYQRFSHRKKLRMTKQEIKEEHKQMEGDPQVKSQRKARHQQMMRNAVANVKEATVVITNPTHYAIAIRYDASEDQVPKVLAKGQDEIAQKMKEEARRLAVPMIENRPVARALYPLVEAGDFIPVEMYESIAEIIALVYQLEEKKKHQI
ncbi:flagellar biosynthesis protein FlhB [Enterococcus lemanii]|uniref:Flagellar biosynthetic protein FlhB n=1 Tax=Enterococcus lemanii TaxID=1159752 RepID=A0ABV9MX31_9ENTE|nr:flagellar biosynthesis protein FlhB [Enterococcus lemanii]MBM7708070.1 flagellar biosynthetic protein FlhB [Enterococcus lemanii]